MTQLYAVSIAYMDYTIMAASIAQLYKTAGLNYDLQPTEWILVDNHWPLKPGWKIAGIDFQTQKLADSLWQGKLVDPGQNLGGHGGLTFGIQQLKYLKDDDLVLNYDLDSWPVTPGWLQAAVDVMKADPSLGYVALLPNRIEKSREWAFEQIAGHRLATHPVTEMWNVTVFRGSVIKGGMLADRKYYGFVETAMLRKIHELGLRFGYLYDFREDQHPIWHCREYCDYKDAHGREGTFPGSFEEYLKEKGIKP